MLPVAPPIPEPETSGHNRTEAQFGVVARQKVRQSVFGTVKTACDLLLVVMSRIAPTVVNFHLHTPPAAASQLFP
jgi:hypothetical protein